VAEDEKVPLACWATVEHGRVVFHDLTSDGAGLRAYRPRNRRERLAKAAVLRRRWRGGRPA
jgi:hypothetical protein